jgi:hypothetical protein
LARRGAADAVGDLGKLGSRGLARWIGELEPRFGSIHR